MKPVRRKRVGNGESMSIAVGVVNSVEPCSCAKRSSGELACRYNHQEVSAGIRPLRARMRTHRAHAPKQILLVRLPDAEGQPEAGQRQLLDEPQTS